MAEIFHFISDVFKGMHGVFSYKDHSVTEELQDIHELVYHCDQPLGAVEDKKNLRDDWFRIGNDIKVSVRSYQERNKDTYGKKVK